MKKQIITLTMCLAMTATAALAQVATTVTPAAPCKTAVEKPCAQKMAPPTEAEKKQFEAKMNKERELFHNALNLTPEQKQKADELHKKAISEAEPLFKKVQEERAKFVELTAKNAPKDEIIKQEMAVKAAKKAVKKHFKESRKQFEAILTKDQLAKLKILREQKKTDMKSHKKCECDKCGKDCKCDKCDACRKHPHKHHGPMGPMGPDEGPEGHPALPLSGNGAPQGPAAPKCNCGK